jgi:hypothetical protein
MNNNKTLLNVFAVIACISVCIGILICLYGCSKSTLSGKVINENKTIEDPQVACLQDSIKKQTIFKHTFKYDDSYPPTLYVYITGEWNNLSDETKESTLIAIGKQWHRCNPDNLVVLTIMAYDLNNTPAMAVFVSKEN